jgi:hypothetical protein
MCYFGLAFVDTPAGDLNTDGFISGDNAIRTRMSNQNSHEIYPWYAGWGSTAYAITGGGAGNAAKVATSGGAGGEAHFYKECSNKGICNRGSGLCECFPGFAGEGCSRSACPNDCSGHGTCERMVDKSPGYRGWDLYATQECTCDAAYFGPDCSLRKCPMGDDPVTKYDGFTRIQLKSKAEYSAGYYDTGKCGSGPTSGLPCSNAAQCAGADFAVTSETRSGYRLWTHEPFGCVTANDAHANAGGGAMCIGWNPWYSKGIMGADNSDVTHDDHATTGDLCYYGRTAASPEVCMQKPVRYSSDAQYKLSAIYTHVMKVTGSDSEATGTLTGGSCIGTGVSLSSPFECSNLDFWSLYLKDVTGQFQIGDSLNVKGAAVGAECDDGTSAQGACTGNKTWSPNTVTGNFGSAFNFDLCNYIKSIGTYYAAGVAGGEQKDEEQVITISFNSITGADNTNEHYFGGHFAIEFTDEMGDTWMTKAIDVTSSVSNKKTGSIAETATVHYDIYPIDTSFTGAGLTPANIYTSLPGGDPTSHIARKIEAALEELPNGVVGDVQVEFIPSTYTIALGGDAGNATYGELLTKRSYSVSFIGNSGNIPPLKVAYSLTDLESSKKVGFTNAKCRGSAANCISPYSGTSWTALAADQSKANVVVQDTDYYGWPRRHAVGSTNKGQNGTKENVECSNRGICDYSSGLCQCFAGFTDEDCSRQNALSMA